MKNGSTMKQKHDHTDEELLDQIKARLDRSEKDRFFDQRLRTLSVDVLAAREQRQRRSRVVRTATLAIGSVATAVLLFVLDPFSSTVETPVVTMPVAESATVTNVDLATSYVDDIIEEESIEILAEAADPDPILLSDEDIDQLFEGL